eukprot:754452-Hanusia_phi.AAC.4
MQGERRNIGRDGEDTNGKDDQGNRRRGRESMDVFGGTESIVIVFLALLFYIVQKLSTWTSNTNCEC